MADGHFNKCKECTKQDVRERYALVADVRRAYDAGRNKTAPRREMRLEKQRRSRARDPEKYKARQAVSNALRAGRLQRLPCAVPECPRKAQAHHEDYSKPLDVIWFCFVHHRQHHGQLKDK